MMGRDGGGGQEVRRGGTDAERGGSLLNCFGRWEGYERQKQPGSWEGGGRGWIIQTGSQCDSSSGQSGKR